MNYGIQISEYDPNLTFGYYGGKFLPFHMGHLSCIIKAASMVDVLFVVVGYDEGYEQKLCQHSKFKWVSSRLRERWVTKATKNLPNVRVLSHYERRSPDHMTDPLVKQANDSLLQKLGGRLDYVFSSEPEYDTYFNKYFPASQHFIFDRNNSPFPISATEIRASGVYSYWDMLPSAVRESYVKRICLCGIESTGKSTMTKLLAAHYLTNFVEEYGRAFYDDINGCFDIDMPEDFHQIAFGHSHAIQQAIPTSNKVLFIDTEETYTQFFRMKGLGEKSTVLEEMIKNKVNQIDTYIYLEPHNDYEMDGTRLPVEEEMRIRDNDYLKALFRDYGITLHIVDEQNRTERLKKCIEIVNNSLKL
ncbi:AAA family ATPase [Psychrobacillus sp. FSL K6-1267]|uniref:AAA family ATPase n=1 Tax=Psychrobacillus sp. FSL K6-1267 TaxID=2921543 RepID=UPI0012AF0BC2|nr:AAA family ATPase [Bacillus sp. N3536]